MTGHARTDRTIQRSREAFIAGLSSGLSVTGAAARANIPRRTAYDWRDADEKFRARWDDALEAGTDILEDEAFRRAYEGCDEPVVAMGRVAKNDDGTQLRIRKYSDTLMALLLKARRKSKFRENVSQELSGPDGAPLPDRTIVILPSNGRD